MSGSVAEVPVMCVSDSAHRLALQLAGKGQRVVYRCSDMWSLCIQREEIEYIVKRRHWFSFWILGFWRVRTLAILNRHGGAIHFCVDSTIHGEIALEVRA